MSSLAQAHKKIVGLGWPMPRYISVTWIWRCWCEDNVGGFLYMEHLLTRIITRCKSQLDPRALSSNFPIKIWETPHYDHHPLYTHRCWIFASSSAYRHK